MMTSLKRTENKYVIKIHNTQELHMWSCKIKHGPIPFLFAASVLAEPFALFAPLFVRTRYIRNKSVNDEKSHFVISLLNNFCLFQDE